MNERSAEHTHEVSVRNARGRVDLEENQRWEFMACTSLESHDQSGGERERAHVRGGGEFRVSARTKQDAGLWLSVES